MDILGHAPFDANKFKENRAALYAKLRYINEYLNHHTYLAGESFSVADISLAVWIAPLFYSVLDENFRKGHFSLVRYYKHILANKSVKKFLRAPFMCQKEWFGVSAKADKPAAKEKAPKEKKAEKKVEKKAEKKVEKVEEPKKAADPLTELPPSPFVLYDFKTFIVNETDKKKRS
jgi:glutathione S-transferase